MMQMDDTRAEFHRRLEALESRLAEARRHVAARQPPATEGLAEIEKGSHALRSRLEKQGDTGWARLKDEIEADFAALIDAFDHWTRHNDSDFGGKR
jgi:hypothetical protein